MSPQRPREAAPSLRPPPELWSAIVPGTRLDLTYGAGRARTRGRFRVACVRPPAGEAQKLAILRKSDSSAVYSLVVMAQGGAWLRSPSGKTYAVSVVLRDGRPYAVNPPAPEALAVTRPKVRVRRGSCEALVPHAQIFDGLPVPSRFLVKVRVAQTRRRGIAR